jgi:hypothetical protein
MQTVSYEEGYNIKTMQTLTVGSASKWHLLGVEIQVI